MKLLIRNFAILLAIAFFHTNSVVKTNKTSTQNDSLVSDDNSGDNRRNEMEESAQSIDLLIFPEIESDDSDVQNGREARAAAKCGQRPAAKRKRRSADHLSEVNRPLTRFRRIVGGHAAKPNGWPWHVGIVQKGKLGCGGSLIDSRHVVTARHCAGGKESEYKVLVGMHDTKNKDKALSVGVERITRHPQFTSRKNPAYHDNIYTHDVAVFRLAKTVKFNKYLQPVCLPEKDAPAGKKCWVTGWGDTKGGADNRYLQEVNVPIVSKDTCNNKAGYNGNIDNTMICAGSPGKDSCSHDSGGPLVCERSKGIWELQGIISWGDGCGKKNRPGIYSHVVALKSWIKQQLK